MADKASQESIADKRKRLYMRSIRRGTKEMDLILTAYADTRLGDMPADALTLYDQFLSENDHDLYQWVTGQDGGPARYAELLADIRQHVPGAG